VLFLSAGPDDRNRAVEGKWSSTGERSLQLARAGDTAPQRLTIVECSDDVLKVRSE
jgi:hypothetical protein